MKKKWGSLILLGTIATFCVASPIITKAATEKIAIDDSNFPDENFRNYVVETCDINSDGQLDADEINEVYDVEVCDSAIKSLEGLTYFTALKHLDCGSNEITELPELPDGLEYLYCYDNELSELPKLPEGLLELDSSLNELGELPELPDGLEYLQCYDNKLTKLPELPSGLLGLDCSDNKLTKLPQLPENLENLFCGYNELAELPELPDGLINLGWEGNGLTELSELPEDLESLSCDDNKLTKLPKLPDGLWQLSCDYNELTELPKLPDGLFTLYCSWNKLTELPELPVSLEYLYCYDNELSGVLDISNHNNLMNLGCSGNELTSVILSDKANYEYIDVTYNNLESESSVTGNNIVWDDMDFIFAPQNGDEEDNSDEEYEGIFQAQSYEFDGTKDLIFTYEVPENTDILDFEYIEFWTDLEYSEDDKEYDYYFGTGSDNFQNLCSVDLEKKQLTLSKDVVKEFNLVEDTEYYLYVYFKAEDEDGLYEAEQGYDDVYFTYKNKSNTDAENTGFGEKDVYRISGKDRYATAFETADALKKQLGVEKFETIVLACGTNFADALAGSYLANVKDAPILMANEGDTKTLVSYLNDNFDSKGTIYILGGTGAVSQKVEDAIKTCGKVKRLSGKDRYITNLAILQEAGVYKEDIIVCTGTGFADSLSASALGKPILLVETTLKAEQKEFLASLDNNNYYIVGGTGAVKENIESEVNKYGKVERISGKTRYQTSVLVAERFFENPEAAVLAYAMNFPDGLAGGPLAKSKNAPLILTETDKENDAVEYAKKNGITKGAVLGGSRWISDDAVKKVFTAKEVIDWK